jgi:hypothetical protein
VNEVVKQAEDANPVPGTDYLTITRQNLAALHGGFFYFRG